jgi:hypothetical protein
MLQLEASQEQAVVLRFKVSTGMLLPQTRSFIASNISDFKSIPVIGSTAGMGPSLTLAILDLPSQLSLSVVAARKGSANWLPPQCHRMTQK